MVQKGGKEYNDGNIGHYVVPSGPPNGTDCNAAARANKEFNYAYNEISRCYVRQRHNLQIRMG